MFEKSAMAILASIGMGAAPALAQGDRYDGAYRHMWDGGYGVGHAIVGVGMMVLFWGAIIFAVVFAVRWLSERGTGGGRTPEALDILRERLARGEIDAEEFSARKKALEG